MKIVQAVQWKSADGKEKAKDKGGERECYSWCVEWEGGDHTAHAMHI